MIFNSDHPRRCGENRLYLTSESTRSGSSPRTRGKPCVLRHTHLFNGITPAGAGKTSPQFAPQGRTQGSPPQVRGKHLGGAPYSKSPRITPAGAGKTIRRYTVVHRSPGSPPQVRGKRSCKVFQQSDAGITPAGAGKTGVRNGLCTGRQDHPRRCGENFRVQPLFGNAVGSPPQVRGKQLNRLTIKRRDRITPAGAGKTICRNQVFFIVQDHPRRCGENRFYSCGDLGKSGSPPQVRGKLPRIYPLSFQPRITPAGAGKTRRWFASSARA